jgi:hypothetical protein
MAADRAGKCRALRKYKMNETSLFGAFRRDKEATVKEDGLLPSLF